MRKVAQKTSSREVHQLLIPDTPIRFIHHVSKLHARYAIGTLFVVFLVEVIESSVPFIFKLIIDSAHKVTNGESNAEDVLQYALLYIIALSIVFIGYRASGFIGMEWVTRANATAYKTLFNYLSSHSHTYFSNRFAGSLASKITHASEGTQSLIEAFTWNYFMAGISLIFTTGYLWSVHIFAALTFMCLLFILFPINVVLAKYRRPHVVRYSEQATRARGYGVDAITNISAVRQYARQKDEQIRFDAEIETMRSFNLKQWKISEWGLALNNVLILAFDFVIIFMAVKFWNSGVLSVGDLVMVITLMLNVQGTLIFIGSSINGFIRRYAEIEEGLSDILSDHEILDVERAGRLSVTAGEIQWEDVAFGYGGQYIFESFNLTIRPRERVGLVGPSGAGKTTFVSLLLRQNELTSGAISIDGQDIKLISQDSLRENIAVVPQEPMLFHRSIRENIAYGKPDATDEEIIAVTKKAQAHEFISVLEDGYDTIVGERGVKLSGGQRQRIAIARAMLKNAPILILDEATSALDSESEVAIQKALHELMKGKTVIAIAHRLSTLREMDRIIVLESGKIVEDGTHGELVKQGRTYARLWEHQAGGFYIE